MLIYKDVHCTINDDTKHFLVHLWHYIAKSSTSNSFLPEARQIMSSAKLLVCFIFQSALLSSRVLKMLSECQTAWIWVSRQMATHPDPSCLHMEQQVCLAG